MLVSLTLLLSPLVMLGLVSNSFEAVLRHEQGHAPVAGAGIEDPPLRMTVKCSDVAGIPRKVLKPYISDFCKNYVYNQPGDVGGNDMEYTLIGPWNQWKLKLTWSTKQLWADRSCEANYQAMASKAGCGSFRTKRRKVVVATKAGGEEHAGPETYSWVITPPQEPDIPESR